MAWKKILYEKQNYPDNFCGPEFLQGLKKNVTVETYGFWESVRGSCVLMQEINALIFYAVVFAFTFNNYVEWRWLLAATVISCLLGYCMWSFLLRWSCKNTSSGRHGGFEDLKTLAIFLGFGFGVSPVLKSLTETISTDTIYATTCLMFMLSLLFHDYGVDVSIVSSSLSLNAAIFGAVCLISRVETSDEAFTLLAFAVELFALWPLLRSKLEERFGNSDIAMTLSGACAVFSGLLMLSTPLALLFIVLHIFISLICPLLLIRMQPNKSTIHGPWDEAVVAEYE